MTNSNKKRADLNMGSKYVAVKINKSQKWINKDVAPIMQKKTMFFHIEAPALPRFFHQILKVQRVELDLV